MRVKLELSTVIINLNFDFAVQDTDTALSPCRSVLEFGEECSGVDDTLCFEQQVVSLVRVVVQDMNSVLVVVYKELGKEFRSERRRRQEQLELCSLVLQAVTNFQRTPSETHVFYIAFQGFVACQFIFFLVDRYQRVFLNPVDILSGPFFSILLVARHAICFTHRSKPFVTVKLPTQFVVLYRPVFPVDVLSVVERWLVAFMYEECMLHSVVGPLLLFLTDSNLIQVNIRSLDVGTCAVIIEQCLCSIFVFS